MFLIEKTFREFIVNRKNPFGFGRLKYTRDVADSKALNELAGPAIIISASGMCESGRILHHLKNNIEDPKNTIMIVGFMAANTLGRKIQEGKRNGKHLWRCLQGPRRGLQNGRLLWTR